MRYFLILPVVLACLGCNDPKAFKHNLNTSNKPWTYEPSGKSSDQFTFAIIGDLNSGEREGVFEVAVEQIKLLRPDLILSIGDLIEGGTEDTIQLKNEYDHFDERVTKAGTFLSCGRQS